MGCGDRKTGKNRIAGVQRVCTTLKEILDGRTILKLTQYNYYILTKICDGIYHNLTILNRRILDRELTFRCDPDVPEMLKLAHEHLYIQFSNVQVVQSRS
jgi:hypothetical protein